jgi:hypothetical protein
MAYKMDKLPSPGTYKQSSEGAPAKMIGLGRMIKGGIGAIKGFADPDLKGQGFKARLGNSLKTGANEFIGSDVFETQDMAAEGEGGETQDLTELKEQVEKNTYDISTIGSGAGSGLTYKGSINGEVKDVISSQTNPLKKTGCVKKYK